MSSSQAGDVQVLCKLQDSPAALNPAQRELQDNRKSMEVQPEDHNCHHSWTCLSCCGVTLVPHNNSTGWSRYLEAP